MYLTGDITQIYSRAAKVRKMLKIISKSQHGPASDFRAGGMWQVIGIHDGSPPSQKYDSWRFATKHPRFRAQYYERWMRFDNNNYYLERAYLHLYLTERSQPEERPYILLHCDPNEDEDSEHYIYKRNPHIHIQVAEQPIPHSHFALCLVNIDDVLSSLDKFDDALEHILFMVIDQVFDLVEK